MTLVQKMFKLFLASERYFKNALKVSMLSHGISCLYSRSDWTRVIISGLLIGLKVREAIQVFPAILVTRLDGTEFTLPFENP